MSWNFNDARRGERLLARCGVADEVDRYAGSASDPYRSIRISRDDPRLARLVKELAQETDDDLNPRFDREYTKAEVDQAQYVVLVVKTAGLKGSANYDEQKWYRSGACPLCGAGARPRPPVFIDASAMGKKLLDCTSHDQLVIVTTQLAERLVEAKLTGFKVRPVCGASSKTDHRWKWLDIGFVWPRVSRPRLLYCPEPCRRCHRAGHYSDWGRPTAFVHRKFPSRVPDFSLSFEYFSRWYDRKPGDRGTTGVGGGAATIISHRAREILQRLKVSKLAFEPVFTEKDPLIDQWPMSAMPSARVRRTK